MKIIVNFDEKGFDVEETDVEAATDEQMLSLLLGMYMRLGRPIAINHVCDSPTCCLKRYHTEIMDSIDETVKIHELSHKHG